MEQQILLGDDIYEVEEIVGMKKSDGRWLYRVRWKGYGSQSDTWEPNENLLLCKDMIEEYQAKNARKSSKKLLKASLLSVNLAKDGSFNSNSSSSSSNGVSNLSSATSQSDEKSCDHLSKVDSPSSVAPAASDTFWKDLSEGRIHIIDEDMYSRVKGRAAKKSRTKAEETNNNQVTTTSNCPKETTPPVEIPIVKWTQNKKRKSCVLQTLSQSFDNSMNSVKILRKKHLRKDHKFWTRKVMTRSRLVVSTKSALLKVEQVNFSPGKVLLKIKGHKAKAVKRVSVKCESQNAELETTIPNEIIIESNQLNPGAQDPASQLSLFQELLSVIEKGDYDQISSLYNRFNQTDSDSLSKVANTLLLTAVIGGHWLSIHALIESGISVNSVSSNGTTALMVACQKGDETLVERLLEQGARKDCQDLTQQTALMIACSMGHKEIVNKLLNCGANFAAVNQARMNALRLAKMSHQSDIQELLTSHISRATAAFERDVRVTVSNTAHIVHALFPLHCFSISESTTFQIAFDHECQDLKPGIGYLLFIAHADVTLSNVRCRLYGPCAVKTVTLNSRKQPSLTEEANFVFSFCPLHNGRNVVSIVTEEAPQSNVKLLVCAYKAELMREASLDPKTTTT